jgi:hypothetical protein
MSSDNITVNVTPANKITQRLDTARSVLDVVFTLIMAWQAAKMICPQLCVQEQMLIARIQQHLPKKTKQATQRQAEEFVADVTKWARDNEQ